MKLLIFLIPGLFILTQQSFASPNSCAANLIPESWIVPSKPLTTRVVFGGEEISTFVSTVGVLKIDGKIVMLKRGELAPSFGGKWTFPGGVAERGETAAQALVREFQEETGLDVTVVRSLGPRMTDRPQNGRLFIVHRFEVQLRNPDSKIMLSGEHVKFALVDPNSARELNMPEVTRELFLEVTNRSATPQSKYLFPLREYSYVVPQLPDHPGSFGAVRRHDNHTGVDLYTHQGAEVLAMEKGRVVEVEAFTGPGVVEDPSPWWNDTQAVLIEGESGVILYGEMIAAPEIQPGAKVEMGQVVGRVMPVLKKDKGKNPINMLHIELYSHGARESVWWEAGQKRPEGLRDVTPLLLEALGRPSIDVQNQRTPGQGAPTY